MSRRECEREAVVGRDSRLVHAECKNYTITNRNSFDSISLRRLTLVNGRARSMLLGKPSGERVDRPHTQQTRTYTHTHNHTLAHVLLLHLCRKYSNCVDKIIKFFAHRSCFGIIFCMGFCIVNRAKFAGASVQSIFLL